MNERFGEYPFQYSQLLKLQQHLQTQETQNQNHKLSELLQKEQQAKETLILLEELQNSNNLDHRDAIQSWKNMKPQQQFTKTPQQLKQKNTSQHPQKNTSRNLFTKTYSQKSQNCRISELKAILSKLESPKKHTKSNQNQKHNKQVESTNQNKHQQTYQQYLKDYQFHEKYSIKTKKANLQQEIYSKTAVSKNRLRTYIRDPNGKKNTVNGNTQIQNIFQTNIVRVPLYLSEYQRIRRRNPSVGFSNGLIGQKQILQRLIKETAQKYPSNLNKQLTNKNNNQRFTLANLLQ